MYIIHEYDLETLTKLILNIAHNKQIYRIQGDSIDEKEQNFNILDGDLAADTIYGNECYVYSNILINPDALVSEIERFGRDVLSITSEANGEYTCLTKTGIRRSIYIDTGVKNVKPVRAKRGVRAEPDKDKPKKGTFVVYMRSLSVEYLPDWVHKSTGDVISDEDNIKQMLSIVIDDQKIFGRLPFRCTDTPLTYHLTNAEYLVPHILIDERFGVRSELIKVFSQHADLKPYGKTANRGFGYPKAALPTTVLLNGTAKVGDLTLFRPTENGICYRRDRRNPPAGYEHFDSCILCGVPLYGPFYVAQKPDTRIFIPFCAVCGESDIDNKVVDIFNGDITHISEYPKTFNDVVQMIPKFPYIPDHIFENYKRSLMWLFSQPFLNITDERILLSNDFLKLVKPDEVMTQLRLADQERKFIVPVIISEA